MFTFFRKRRSPPPLETKLDPINNIFTALFMNRWVCVYFCRKCCPGQIWSCIFTRCYLPWTSCQEPALRLLYTVGPPTQQVLSLPRQASWGCKKQDVLVSKTWYIYFFCTHWWSLLSSVRVLHGVIVHLDSGPHAQSCHGLSSFLHAYGSLSSVRHVETDALVLANLCNLEFGCWG